MITNPIIEFQNINKKFGEFSANEEISFAIEPNTVHSLIGENGAGKTTLMNILFGIYKQDSGKIFINGKQVSFKNSLDAIKNNIGMVHQHFELIDDFTVLENIILGDEESDYGFLNLNKSRRILTDLIAKYNLGINLDEKVCNISISEKQKIELLKLLYRKSEILIFDEPTAVLSPIEIEEFFKIIRKFKEERKTIILITHKLNEIKELADKVTVLRKGKVVYEVNSDILDISVLSKEIVGELETVLDLSVRENNLSKEPFIELKNVMFRQENVSVLCGINISVFGGEIYSVCGVEGNGQSQIVDLIAGITNKTSGSINMKYESISLVPDDRLEKGMIKEFNTGENVLIRNNKHKYISSDRIYRTSKEIVEKYDIRLPAINAPLESLSGGNQQKVIFGREIELGNNIMVFVHPTRGVDINATAYIHKIILEQRNKGKAVLLITSDLDEALKLSDKIGILYKGLIGKEFLRNEFDENTVKRNNVLQSIGKAMIGVNVA